MTINNSQRVVWLDVVRLVAMFTVVCCHSTDPFNFCPDSSVPNLGEIKLWGAVYGALLRPCVPLFVMLTGALLLPVSTTSTAAFYRKRIGRVFFPFVLWGIVYNLFPWFLGLLGFAPDTLLNFFPYSGDDATRQSLAVSVKWISEMPLNFSPVPVHLWYIYLLIGLYLYMPIFSAWVERASEKAKLWFLVAWGITTLLPYYFEYVSPYIWGSCSWNQFHALYYFAGFNGYLLLGHYLRRHVAPLSRVVLFGLPSFAIGYAVTFLGFRHATALPSCPDEMLELFFTYNSLNVVMMTVPVFMLISHVRIASPRVVAMLANLTACGFGVYMVHYFLTGPSVELVRWVGIPIALQIPVAAVVAFAVSWIVVDAIRRACGRYARYVVG